MRKKVKMVVAVCMVVLLAACQPATSSPEETLPVETESQENQPGDMVESTSEATTTMEAAEQTTKQEEKQESSTAETIERGMESPSGTTEAVQEATENIRNKKDSETQKKQEPEQGDGQPEAAPQEKEESKKAEEPAPEPTDTPERQPEPVAPEPQAPQPEVPQPEAPKPEPQPEPQPEPEPKPEPEPVPPPAPAETQPKTCYDYPFDTEAIRGELIGIGQGAGLAHVEKTLDNSSWAAPVTASEGFQGEALKRSLVDYVSSMPAMAEMYGGNPLTEFCIYVEDAGGGSYTFYFLY